MRDARERHHACYSPNESSLFLFLSLFRSLCFFVCCFISTKKAWAYAPSFVMLLIMKENCEAIKFHPRSGEGTLRGDCRYFKKKKGILEFVSQICSKFLEKLNITELSLF